MTNQIIHDCPYCGEWIEIKEDPGPEQAIHCPKCGNDFIPMPN
jgi:predicted RNA-binding Zn-ribbon protein involved in translation (DUF1610 family)